MKISRIVLLALFVAGIMMAGAGQTMAQDGKALYAQKGCVGCHGPDGKSMIPMYPKLAGQHSAYLVAQMKDFKSKKRTNGQAAVMVGMVAALSEGDMKKIADFLQSVK